MKSVLKYIGSKDTFDAYKYIKDMNIDTYCEPFAGGFGAGLNLLENGFKGRVILNDADWQVYNFWCCLVEDWEYLYERIEILLKEVFKYHTSDEQTHIVYQWKLREENYDKASAEYFIRTCSTMNGLNIDKRKFAELSKEVFKHQSELLAQGSVQITNFDYSVILKNYDSVTTFMLVDPPYYDVGAGKYYRNDSDFFYHKGLREALEGLESKMLITYNHKMYIMDLYKNLTGFKAYFMPKTMHIRYVEVYYSNFGYIDGTIESANNIEDVLDTSVFDLF